jgi:nitrite reductase/ring-hydroxylating ferredoxin subunit
VGVGLAGAGAAALAGLADWQYTQDNARRTGVAHAMLNVAAMSCYATSWLCRGRGRYRSGRRASAVGYGLVLLSGYLGGSLVSRHRVGVDHADRRLEPRQFTVAVPAAELYERQPMRVRVAGVSVLLVRSGDNIYALGEECSHLGGPLAQGWLRADTVVCPWHGSSYDLATGRVRRGRPPARCRCSRLG